MSITYGRVKIGIDDRVYFDGTYLATGHWLVNTKAMLLKYPPKFTGMIQQGAPFTHNVNSYRAFSKGIPNSDMLTNLIARTSDAQLELDAFAAPFMRAHAGMLVAHLQHEHQSVAFVRHQYLEMFNSELHATYINADTLVDDLANMVVFRKKPECTDVDGIIMGIAL